MSSIVPDGERNAARDAALPEAVSVPITRCKNCAAVLLGRFCVNCSQAADVHVPTTKELLHELLEGLTHSDSRLWRTLTTLWFRPGKLTEEFVAGRRVAYLPPFRLYLIVSILFFLIASFMHTQVALVKLDEALKPAAPPTAVQPRAAAPGSAAPRSAAPRSAAPAVDTETNCKDVHFPAFDKHPTWNARIVHACEAAVRENNDSLVHLAIGTLSKAMFLFLPLIAFLHMLMYWRPRYRYAEQLLFFVHLQAFYFSVAILFVSVSNAVDSWPQLEASGSILQTLLGWILPIYTVAAMRRVFHRSWLGTLLKAIALFFVYSIAFGFTLAGAFVYAAFQL
jgi:hypothetical protein